MKWFLHKWSLGLMLAALPLFSGCESDSANAADIEVSSTAAVTSPPSMTVATASDVSTAVGISADIQSQSPSATTVEQSLPAGVDPASALASVIKLAQAGMSESVILSYISNSAAPFNLTSDQMIYLRDLGLSDSTINVMLQRDQAFAAGQSPPPTATVATAPLTPPAEVVQTVPADTTYTYFYDSLSPYGSWVFVTDYGWCWQPTVVAINRGWQPYCDSGHWVYTDCGWYWTSDYSWGWAPFHYGRWFRHPSRGWCWTPGREWGPSWVSWRNNNDYCGWAPLPPGAVFRPGIGLTFHGRHVDASFNFGLSVDLFTFVPAGRFTDRHPGRFRAGRGQDTRIFNDTTVINNIVVGNNNTIINRGIGTERVERATHTTIRPVHVEARDDHNPRNGRHEQFNPGGNTLVVNRPSLRDHAPEAANNAQRPGGSRNTPSDNQRRDNDNNRPPFVRGNNSPANSANPSTGNQRDRSRDNSREINNSPNNQHTTPSEVRTRPNQGNNPPANNVSSGGNNALQPIQNRPSPFTPVGQNNPPNQNPSGIRNNPPRTAAPSTPITAPASAPATAPGTRVTAPSVPVTAPSTRATAPSTPTTAPSPIVRPDRGQQNQPNNQRPVVTTPTPSPRVQAPVINPATSSPRTIVPGNQNQNSRYNSPRVESQIVPPRAPQQVQPTFPRQERPAVSVPATPSGGGRSEGQSSGGQGQSSGGGNRSGGGKQSGSDNRRNR